MLLVSKIFSEKTNIQFYYVFWEDYEIDLGNLVITLTDTDTGQNFVMNALKAYRKHIKAMGLYRGIILVYGKYAYNSLSAIESCQETKGDISGIMDSYYFTEAWGSLVFGDKLGTILWFVEDEMVFPTFDLLYYCCVKTEQFPKYNVIRLYTDRTSCIINVNDKMIQRLAKAKLGGFQYSSRDCIYLGVQYKEV